MGNRGVVARSPATPEHIYPGGGSPPTMREDELATAVVEHFEAAFDDADSDD